LPNIDVAIEPGLTEFIRIAFGANSLAAVRVYAFNPAFEAACTAVFGMPIYALIDDKLIIKAPSLSIYKNFSVVKIAPFRLISI